MKDDRVVSDFYWFFFLLNRRPPSATRFPYARLFRSDLRRISEVVGMDEEAKRSDPAPEAIYIKGGFVTFSDQKAETLAKEWIADVADLDANDSSKLVFPGI